MGQIIEKDIRSMNTEVVDLAIVADDVLQLFR